MRNFLTKEETQMLLNWGHLQQDIPQIEEAIKICRLEDKNDKRISRKRAIEILGRKDFISGISRAAFHWTASRTNDEGESVYFDCSKLFN